MRTISYSKFLILSAIFSWAQTGNAQTPPGAVRVGPLYAYPEVGIAVKRDDNIAIQPAATAQSDTILNLRLSVRLEAKKDANLYNFGYRGDYNRYARQTTDNYENHELFADANLPLDMRNDLKLKLQYLDGTDPRGTLNNTATATPNKWHQSGIFGFYSYGAQDAAGRIELEGGYVDKRYVNNRFVTSALDYDRTNYGGTFLWRVRSKTYLTFNLKQSLNHYRDPTVALDSTDTFALVGVRWDATAATTGRFAVGRETKKFDGAGAAAGRQDFSGIAWEGSVFWRPLSYSSVDVKTQRRTIDSTGLGDFTVNQTHQAAWTHAWSDRFTSIVTGTFSNDEFSRAPVAAAGGDSREDTTKSGGLRLNYAMRRWLKIGADYQYTTRDANDTSFGYKRNQMSIFISATP